jgi:hypothetical protein
VLPVACVETRMNSPVSEQVRVRVQVRTRVRIRVRRVSKRIDSIEALGSWVPKFPGNGT